MRPRHRAHFDLEQTRLDRHHLLFRLRGGSAGSAGEGQQWIGLCLAVLCVTLISLPWKKPFNAIALAGMVIWIIVTRAIPGLEFLQRNPLWLLVGLACVIASCWDPDPESVEDEVELDPDLARSLQAMG